MPLKPPRDGGLRVDVDVHTNPNQKSDRDVLPVDMPGRNVVDPWTRVDNPQRPIKSVGPDAGLDVILPAPTVTVHPALHFAESFPVMNKSLESYWLKSVAELPDADREGFRVYRERQYVDVPDGGIVLVGIDADTGFYRARSSNELRPSGPWMLRDIESGIWHPHSDFNTRTNALTDASLEVFRTELDVSGVEPGSDGVIRHDGKLYVVIHEQAYQVMQDLGASRPEYKVWRLVNPGQPVATDSANIYRAHLGGETLAITLSERNTWVSILTGLRGGMDANAPAGANPFNFHRPWLTGAGPSGGQAPVVVATTRAQVKRYFADSTDQHADDFIARFGEAGVAEVELKRLELEFPQLDREVAAWETGYKGKDSAERRRRQAIGARVRRLFKWQGESSEKVYVDGRLVGFKLELDLGGRGNLTLPVFSTRLSSVVALGLKGTTSKNMGSLFSMFSHIETLEVHRFTGKGDVLWDEIHKLTQLRVLQIRESNVWLQRVHEVHFIRLAGLRELSLANCSIWPGLTVAGMTTLRVLRVRSCDLQGLPGGLSDLSVVSRLQVLDLHHNPNLTVAPDVTHMSDLRELDLSNTYIVRPPVGLDSPTGPVRLEVLNLSHNGWLAVPPTLTGLTALREVDLSRTSINRFPEGVTSAIPKTSLNLAYSGIASIPQTVELRKGFDLTATPISDPADFRRLIAARRATGVDIWLAGFQTYGGGNHWLHNVPQAQIAAKNALWDALNSEENFAMMKQIKNLLRTPEFRVERQLLQRRVWRFLEFFHETGYREQARLRNMATEETSPGKMLERLEDEINKSDPQWQNPPVHDLSKRPRLN
ncbi:MAG TPA: hypothetical protein VNV36_12310 [Pseudomonas sp.]|uniref:leucine-rich repeat domain-containing protein n=1 Tax=Pseudomonas sp. TaxID=306 RepID=UPI002CB4F1BB|nr:hypothetical protein [Pseudomonas sp.]HWH87543.1 hypothetical protein [Pseudomonas sp.]